MWFSGEIDFRGYARRDRGADATAPHAHVAASFLSRSKRDDRLRA
jgi:hypothetical protein